MTEKYENLYGVVGIFPSEVAELENPDNVKRLKELAKHDKIVAIGEIGLDYHYEETDKALQHKWFAGQMDIARELKLPIALIFVPMFVTACTPCAGNPARSRSRSSSKLSSS